MDDPKSYTAPETGADVMRAVIEALAKYSFQVHLPPHRESRESLEREFFQLLNSLPIELPTMMGDFEPPSLEEWYVKEQQLMQFFAQRISLSSLEGLRGQTDLGNQSFPIELTIKNVLLDMPRTRQFGLGVQSAVQDIRAEKEPGVPIKILEAGCGAFPVLAISAALADPGAQIVCYELNPSAAHMATVIIERLGLSSQIHVHLGDATQLSFAPGTKFDLIVSETFDAGLQGEPIHQILKEARRYAHEKTIVIPESITLSGLVIDSDKPYHRPRAYGLFPPGGHQEPRNLINETAAGQYETTLVPGTGPSFVTLRIPHKNLSEDVSHAIVYTDVSVYKNFRLLPCNSFATRMTAYTTNNHGEQSGHLVVREGDDLVIRIVPGTSRPPELPETEDQKDAH